MIEIKNLQKIVGQHIIVDIGSFSVDAGEIAALVGPAGCGKEPLFDLLIGKTLPSSGEIRLAGAHPHDRESFSRHVGVLFAEDSLYVRRSPLANLVFQSRLYGLPDDRAIQILAELSLTEQSRANITQLSSGMQRRLAFGRAILHRPQVLLLFEPFARCDETSISVLRNHLRKMTDDGVSILILADDAANLDNLCDATVPMQGGRLLEIIQPQEADRQTAFPFKIPVRLEDKVKLLNPAEILFVEAEEGRSLLHTIEGPLPAPFTLADLEERLSRSGFFRAHRSYLVNLQHVKEVIPYTRNSFSLRLNDEKQTEIPLSKSAAAELRSLLGY